jgi:ABC-type molybdate transport system substrate-binding protein
MKRPLLALAALVAAICAHAAHIRVLAIPAAREAMTAVAPAFERQTGHHVVFEYLEDDLAKTASTDERIDAVVAPVADMGVLARAYKIVPDSRRTLGRTAPTASASQGIVLMIAALHGDHEEAARTFCAYLTLPETIAALRRSGLSAP